MACQPAPVHLTAAAAGDACRKCWWVTTSARFQKDAGWAGAITGENYEHRRSALLLPLRPSEREAEFL